MKRVLILSLAGALALPLFAEEPKSTETKPAEAPKQATAAPAANADSPLVQAAKRSNRKNGGKKTTIVITNESLRASKGHITTTSAQAPINVPEPTPGPEQQLAEKQAKRAAEAKRLEETRAANAKKAAAHREAVRRNAAEGAEEGLYEGLDTDPAEAEHAAGSTSGKPPL